MLCPYCQETIAEGAIKCKHCGEILDQERHAELIAFQMPKVDSSDSIQLADSNAIVSTSGRSITQIVSGLASLALLAYVIWTFAPFLGAVVAKLIPGNADRTIVAPLTSRFDSKLGPNSGAKTLYQIWQFKNAPEPGVYEDELTGGELLYECKVGGKYPAYFGYINLKHIFYANLPVPDDKPWSVFIGGILYGNRYQMWTAPPTHGGVGIINQLKLQGCQIPPDLTEKARRAIPQESAEVVSPAIASSVPMQSQTQSAPIATLDSPATLDPAFAEELKIPIKKGEEYEKVKPALLRAGWKPVEFEEKIHELPEIKYCQQGGLGQCGIWLTAGKGNYLGITTTNDGYVILSWGRTNSLP